MWFKNIQGQLERVHMSFGERVRLARKRKKMTLKQLADAVGVSPQAVSAWEKMDNVTSISRLNVVANALGVDWGWLLGDEADRDGATSSEVKPSPFAQQYGEYTPVINLKDAAFFSAFSIQSSRVPEARGYVLPTHELIGPTFAIELDDDSMEPLFSEGDVVIFNSTLDVTNTDYVIGMLLKQWDKPLFRKYSFNDQEDKDPMITLTALNESYPAVRFGFTEGCDGPGFILGIMVEHRKFRPGLKKTSWS